MADAVDGVRKGKRGKERMREGKKEEERIMM